VFAALRQPRTVRHWLQWRIFRRARTCEALHRSCPTGTTLMQPGSGRFAVVSRAGSAAQKLSHWDNIDAALLRWIFQWSTALRRAAPKLSQWDDIDAALLRRFASAKSAVEGLHRSCPSGTTLMQRFSGTFTSGNFFAPLAEVGRPGKNVANPGAGVDLPVDCRGLPRLPRVGGLAHASWTGSGGLVLPRQVGSWLWPFGLPFGISASL